MERTFDSHLDVRQRVVRYVCIDSCFVGSQVGDYVFILWPIQSSRSCIVFAHRWSFFFMRCDFWYGFLSTEKRKEGKINNNENRFTYSHCVKPHVTPVTKISKRSCFRRNEFVTQISVVSSWFHFVSLKCWRKKKKQISLLFFSVFAFFFSLKNWMNNLFLCRNFQCISSHNHHRYHHKQNAIIQFLLNKNYTQIIRNWYFARIQIRLRKFNYSCAV